MGEIHRDPYQGSFHPGWKEGGVFSYSRPTFVLLPSLRIPPVFSFQLLVSPVFFLFLFLGGSSLATLAVKFPSGNFKRAGIERERLGTRQMVSRASNEENQHSNARLEISRYCCWRQPASQPPEYVGYKATPVHNGSNV